MNDHETSLETALGQKLSLAASESPKSLRASVLAEVDQELRSRRRDRIATRLVFSCLLLGIVGNFVIKQQEGTHTAHWITQERTASGALLAEAEQPDPTPSFSESYLLAYYPSSLSLWGTDRAAQSAQARAMAAWIDEFAITGQVRNR